MLPFGPPGPSDWHSRLHGSAKWLIGAPCLTQWSPHATQSLPSSEPNEAKGSKMEPKVIAIQAQRSPSSYHLAHNCCKLHNPSRPQRICKKYAQIRWTRRLAFRRGSLSLPAKPQRICKTCAQIRWTRQGRTNPSKPQRIWKKYVQIRVQLTVQLTVTPDPAFFA